MAIEAFIASLQRFDAPSRPWLQQRLPSRWWPRDFEAAAAFVAESVGDAPFYLYGAGTHTQALLPLLKGRLKGIGDGRPKHDQRIGGFPVLSVEALKRDEEAKIVLSHAEFEDGMRDDLLNAGIAAERIVPIYLDPRYGELVCSSLAPEVARELAGVPERAGRKRIVFVNARPRRIFDEHIIGSLGELGNYQLIQLKMDRLESTGAGSAFEAGLSARNGLQLCLDLLRELQPDLIYVQEHYSSGNFLPLIPALAFPEIPVVGEFYDFLGLILDDPYILSRESYWREQDVQLGLDAEHWCIKHLAGIVTKESGPVLEEYLRGARYLEAQPHLPSRYFSTRRTRPRTPPRLVWAGAIAASHQSSAIIGNNQLLDVFTELVELGFEVTAYSSCPDQETLQSQYADYLELAKGGRFQMLPRIPQAELIERLARDFDYGIAFGKLKAGHQQGLSNKVTVSGKMFSYVAAALPMLVADYYDVMGGWVEKFGLGLLVDPDNLGDLPKRLAGCDYEPMVENICRYRREHNFEALLSAVTAFIDDLM